MGTWPIIRPFEPECLITKMHIFPSLLINYLAVYSHQRHTQMLSHHRVAPHTVFARQALEALDLLLAFITLLRVAVPTHPFVRGNLKCGMNV